MTKKKLLADVACTIVHQTHLAYLIDAADKRVWVPKSVCEWDPDSKVMTMPEPLAIDKGLV